MTSQRSQTFHSTSGGGSLRTTAAAASRSVEAP